MKFAATAFAFTLAFKSLLPIEPSHTETFGYECRAGAHNFIRMNVKHQSVFFVNEMHSFLLDASYRPVLNQGHEAIVSVAQRVFFDGVGFGINCSYMATDVPGAWLTQISPGAELFFGNAQLFYNINKPMTMTKSFKMGKIQSHIVSEFGANYFIGSHKIGLSPFYNHASKSWGMRYDLSILLGNIVMLGFSPSHDKNHKQFLISLGFKFGGKRISHSTPLPKTNEMRYIVKKKKAIPKNIVGGLKRGPATYPEPVFIKAKEIAPRDKKAEEPKGWWEYIFGSKEPKGEDKKNDGSFPDYPDSSPTVGFDMPAKAAPEPSPEQPPAPPMTADREASVSKK